MFISLALDRLEEARIIAQRHRGGEIDADVLLGAIGFFAVPTLITTYLLLVALTNRSYLSITDGVLRVRHGPLPLRRDTSVPTADVERLFCSREHGSSRSGVVFYSLNARLYTGAVVPVVTHLSRPVTAMFLQQWLGETLNLTSPVGPVDVAAKQRFIDIESALAAKQK